ncbi:MAG: hypothetical protein AAB966_03025 [Patescibacteria group bacterium]
MSANIPAAAQNVPTLSEIWISYDELKNTHVVQFCTILKRVIKAYDKTHLFLEAILTMLLEMKIDYETGLSGGDAMPAERVAYFQQELKKTQEKINAVDYILNAFNNARGRVGSNLAYDAECTFDAIDRCIEHFSRFE